MVVLVVVLVVVVVVDVRVVSEQFCPLGWCGLKKNLVYRTILCGYLMGYHGSENGEFT